MNGGGSCPPGKCTFFGGGQCLNLGVVNVRILGVVNVRLANNLTPQDPVSVEPGHYMYSIGGFTVAGAMLEAATNKTFEQLMTEVGKS